MFSPTVCLSQSVSNLEKLEDGTFKLTTDEEIHYSKSVIITAGIGAFQPRRLEFDSAPSHLRVRTCIISSMICNNLKGNV